MPDCQPEVPQEEKALEVEDHNYMHDGVAFAFQVDSLNEWDLESNGFTHIIPVI